MVVVGCSVMFSNVQYPVIRDHRYVIPCTPVVVVVVVVALSVLSVHSVLSTFRIFSESVDTMLVNSK